MEEEFKAPLDIKPWIARQATLELEMQVKLLEEEKRMQNVRITKLMKAMQEKQEQSNHERENARDVVWKHTRPPLRDLYPLDVNPTKWM